MTLERLQQDLQNQAKTITELVQAESRRQDRETAQNEIDKLKAAHMDERFDRLEARITAVYSLGKWLLTAAGSTFLLAVVTFVVKGGLFNG